MKKKHKTEVTLRSVSDLIEGLAASVAKGFSHVDSRFMQIESRLDRFEKKTDERFNQVEENIKSTRQAILDVGDRFVPRFEFDNLLIRFNKLEQKIRGKSR